MPRLSDLFGLAVLAWPFLAGAQTPSEGEGRHLQVPAWICLIAPQPPVEMKTS